MPAVGLVGCGRWGVHILRDLLSLGCSVVVADPSPEARDKAMAAGVAVVAAVAEMPRSLEAYIVAVPATGHAAVLTALLDRQVPVFVEKPMTTDPVEAAELAAVAGERLFVMDKWRYHPGVQRLAQIVHGAELGAVESLRITFSGWGNPHGDVDFTWVVASHILSIVREVLGTVPPPSQALAECHRGIPVGLFGALGEPALVQFLLHAREPHYVRRIELACTDGVAELADAYAGHLTIYRDGLISPRTTPIGEIWPISTEMPLLRELRAFCLHVRGGPPPHSSAAEGAEAIAQIVALRRLAGITG